MRRSGLLAGGFAAAAAALALASAGGSSPDAGADVRAKPWLPVLKRPGAVVWAVGDAANGGAEGRALGSMLASTRLDRFLYLGDVYETGTAADFDRNYAPAFGTLGARTAPTLGNHEYANRTRGYLPYWEGVRGEAPPAWYAIAASGWQIISLDSNEEHGPGSPQVGWLQRKLSRTEKFGSCRIAFTHHPRFSAGRHGDDPSMATLWGELAGRASVWIAGHDHDFQRFHPVDGIVEVVAGSGGHSSYGVATDGRLASYDAEHVGALRIRLGRGAATLRFVSAGGATLDSSRVACRR